MSSIALEILIKARDMASKTIAGVADEAKKLNPTLATLNAQGAAASRAFAVGLAAAGASATAFVGYGVKVAGELEAATQGFKTLLGSASEADRVMALIKTEAARTPFEIRGLTQATQMLASVTHDGDKAVKTVLDIGEALAAMGKGQAELDRVAVNLQQIAALGRANAIDIKQFAYAGIPIYDMLAEKTKLAGEALQEFIAKGGVTFDMLADTFDKANDKGGRFFGAFINQAGTFNQLWSNMKDSVDIFMADFVKQTGLFSMVKEAVAGLTRVIQENKAQIIDLASNGLRLLRENIPIIAGAITGALIPALVALISVGGGWVIALAAIGAGTAYAIQKFQEMATVSERLAAGNDKVKGSLDALILTEQRNIAALEAKKPLYSANAQAYIGMLQKESQAHIEFDRLQKQLSDAVTAREQAAWNVKTAFFEKKARLQYQEALNEENTIRLQVDAVQRGLDDMAAKRDKDMDAKIRLGEKEYANRSALLDRLKVTEGTTRDEILAMSATASEKEIRIAVDKAKRQAEIMAQLKDTLAKIAAVPIIQEIRMAYTSPTSASKGSIFQSLGSVALNVGKQVTKAGQDYTAAISKMEAEFSKANATAGKLSGSLGGLGTAGGGGASGVDKAKQAAEKAAKEFEKLTKDVQDNWNAYGDLKNKVKESLASLEREHTDKVKSINDKIQSLIGNAKELSRAFNIQWGGQSNDIASAYVDQMQKVNDISAQLDAERMKSFDDKSADRIRELQEQLTKEQKALSDHKDIATTYAAEIADAQRRNGLTEFERFLEDTARKREEMLKEYNEKQDLLKKEIDDLTEQRRREDEIYEQKKAALNRVMLAVKDFGTVWQKVFSDMNKATDERVKSMNTALDSLKGRLESVLSLQRQTNTANASAASLPGRASGGPVEEGRAYRVGEHGEEIFVPGTDGTIIPHGANVRRGIGRGSPIGGGQNVQIVFDFSGSTLLDERTAVKITDLVVDRLKKVVRIPSRSS